jgi:hypothetical protein
VGRSVIAEPQRARAVNATMMQLVQTPRFTSATAVGIVLSLAACSQEPEPQPTAQETEAIVDAVARASATPIAVPTATAENTLTLEGLGALKLGQAPDAARGWMERGAQASDRCRIISNPAFPGVYGIAEGGVIKRVTVAGASAVKFVEGIGVGASRAAVDGAFPGFREEPHKYVDGGVYLTAPNAASGDPAVRLELDDGGMVTAMHVGMMPVLGYVEGCA